MALARHPGPRPHLPARHLATSPSPSSSPPASPPSATNSSNNPSALSALLDRHRRAVIAIGLATSIIAALIIIPAITKPTSTTTATAADLTTTGFTPVPTGIDWHAAKRTPDLHNCLGEPVDACTLVHGTGPDILLIGDSHAAMLIPTFTAIARTEHLTLSVSVEGACPWQRDLFVVPLNVFGQKSGSKTAKRSRTTPTTALSRN